MVDFSTHRPGSAFSGSWIWDCFYVRIREKVAKGCETGIGDAKWDSASIFHIEMLRNLY